MLRLLSDREMKIIQYRVNHKSYKLHTVRKVLCFTLYTKQFSLPKHDHANVRTTKTHLTTNTGVELLTIANIILQIIKANVNGNTQ